MLLLCNILFHPIINTNVKQFKYATMNFRPAYILFALSAIMYTNLYAQRFKPGIIAGLAITDIVGVDPWDEDYKKIGLTLGGLLSTSLSDRNSVQFEILYTQKGSLQQPDSSINNYKYSKISLDYIEIPLLFKHSFKFNLSGRMIDGTYFEVGPSYGRLVRLRVNSDFLIFKDVDLFKKNEIALNLGVGYNFGDKISFNVRYSNSIIPVVKHAILLNDFFWRTFNKGDNVLFSFTLRYMI